MTTDWRNNHLLLAEKLVLHIDAEKTTTFDKLEARALKHGIAMNVFDRAIEKLHKLPNIKRTVKLGTVHYELQAVKPKTGPILSGEWVAQHYPWPGKNGIPPFVMPFPELDLSYLFMKPEEAEDYKAQMKGKRTFKRKSYEHARR
jgi:hypothetical protein